MLVAQVLLAALLMVAGLLLLRPSPWLAVVLGVLCAAWLPANNGYLEGPILLTVAENHGLTLGDLLSYAGFALALFAGSRWRRNQARSGRSPLGRPAVVAFVVVLVLLLGCGLVLSWLQPDTQNGAASPVTPASSTTGPSGR